MDPETPGAGEQRGTDQFDLIGDHGADRHDVLGGQAPSGEFGGGSTRARGARGFRRLLTVAIVVGGLLTAGSVAVVNAASPSPSTSPAPAATGATAARGATAAPGGTTNPAHNCDQSSANGSTPSSSGATQSY